MESKRFGLFLTGAFLRLGADGSVRLFDLRHLEHSTILYEDMGSSPAGGPANAMAGELRTRILHYNTTLQYSNP